MKTRIFIFSLIAIFAVSCRTTKEVTTNTVIKDSVVYKTNTIIRDSIITIVLPQDTVFINRFIELDRFNVIKDIDTIIVESGIIGAKAWVYKSNLGVKAYVSDSTLFYKLDSARISIIKYKELYEIERTKQVIEKTKYRNTAFGKFAIWWFIGSIIIMFLALVLKLKGII